MPARPKKKHRNMGCEYQYSNLYLKYECSLFKLSLQMTNYWEFYDTRHFMRNMKFEDRNILFLKTELSNLTEKWIRVKIVQYNY